MHLKWSCTDNTVTVSQHMNSNCDDTAAYTYPVEKDNAGCQKVLDAWYTVTCTSSSITADICVGTQYTTPSVDDWVPDWSWDFTTPEVDADMTCEVTDNAAAATCVAAGVGGEMACGYASGCVYRGNGCVYGSVTAYCMPKLDCVYTLNNDYKVTLDKDGGCGTYEAPGGISGNGQGKDDNAASLLTLFCLVALFFQL